MAYKPIIVVAGEPNSIFTEIFFKSLKIKKFKSPIILIASLNLIKLQMRKLNIKKKIRNINFLDIKNSNLDNKKINLIDINFSQKKPFDKISSRSNDYIKMCFDIALKILKKKFTDKFINGPISKKFFLEKKYLGITEYLARKTKIKNKPTMLIYNSIFSVCPITTHLPINRVTKVLSKTKIVNDVININSFYKKKLNKKPKFAILGLNPHCESIDKISEEKRIIKPAVKLLIEKKINIKGPFSADTFFSKKNISHYDIVIGMYHDQVLTPMKAIFGFNAINLTLGLPFLRVSPDHGTNNQMLGKNKSNAQSLISSINFYRKIK